MVDGDAWCAVAALEASRSDQISGSGVDGGGGGGGGRDGGGMWVCIVAVSCIRGVSISGVLLKRRPGSDYRLE